MLLLHSKGWSLRYSPGQGNLRRWVVGCGGGAREGTMPLAQLSAGFQSLFPLPTSKLGPSGADSWVGGVFFFYILGLCGSLQWILLCGWEFLPLPHSPQVFTVRGFEALFLWAETLDCMSFLLPSCSFQFILTLMRDQLIHQPPPHLPRSSSCLLDASPLCPAACLFPCYQSGKMFLL